MSLADTLAASLAARNLVLVGDPRQLDQPQQGSHPEGAEVSALGHLFGDATTIPDGAGIFLAETWRLAPAINAFTSELFYDGRLAARPGNARQRLNGRTPFADGAGAALWFIPVNHSGNQSSSREEVDAVVAACDRLLRPGVTWTDARRASHPLRGTDVLVVAPYNAHVELLKVALVPRGIRVGATSVGEDASLDPIAMCSSVAWKDAFRRQATLDTLQAATRCASAEIARLQRLEIDVSFDDQDLVQQVVTATCAGALTWDPDRVPLRTHLRDALRLVCRRLRIRAAADDTNPSHRVTMIALDDLDDEDPVWSEAGLVMASPADALRSAQATHYFESELWLRSAGDQVVLRVLRAMSDGHTTPADLAAATGLSVALVAAARRRLGRTVRQIPPELVSSVRSEGRADDATDASMRTRSLDSGSTSKT